MNIGIGTIVELCVLPQGRLAVGGDTIEPPLLLLASRSAAMFALAGRAFVLYPAP